ncbi:MAG: 3-deoxy-manno-octulosonate cytidylyltransferase [Verrucomicrobiae bacterium]|nr:3-deoxy-manno-octulosonate cytidylyltransferase [Verrucomicrobiae bacterium]
MHKTVAIVQARMGSTRLPGKMLRRLAGRPLIDHVLARLTASIQPKGPLDAIVLATSTAPDNDPLVDHVAKRWPEIVIVRGSEDDVLARFVTALRQIGATQFVRATGDCPLINTDAMAQMLTALETTGADVINYQPGYEYVDKGLEAVTAAALLRVAEDPQLTARDREHVTSLLYRHPDRYRVGYIASDPVLRRGDIRLTVDTADDLRFFETLLALLPGDPQHARLPDVVKVLDQHPEVIAINASSGRKSTRHERARLGYRCDGGAALGLGHVVGCLRLAKLLARELGWGSEFVVRDDPATVALVKQAGFAMEVLSADTPPERDIARLIHKAEESDWAGVVVNFCKDDLERYSESFGGLKTARVPLIFMDNPLPPSYRLGDLLLNALPHPDYAGYDPQAHPRCYDGLEYFILEDVFSSSQRGSGVPAATGTEFTSCRGGDAAPTTRKVAETVQRILVAMGGGDLANLTGLVIQGLAAAQFTGEVDVVLGAACPHRATVEKLLTSTGLRGAVAVNVTDMPARIRRADLGFSALGLTTYEMAGSGLPVGIIAGSELNAGVARQYAEKYRAADYLGHGAQVQPRDVAAWLRRMEADVDRRRAMSAAGKHIGARVAEIPGLVEAVIGQAVQCGVR